MPYDDGPRKDRDGDDPPPFWRIDPRILLVLPAIFIAFIGLRLAATPVFWALLILAGLIWAAARIYRSSRD
ncbi:MAG: hypothetical protein AAFX03_11220 [Pseudomonadota bacterium]